MKKLAVAMGGGMALALVAVATHSAPAPAQEAKGIAPEEIDRNVMHVQVILDHLGFSPGVIDGRRGMSLTAALKGFQEARGLPITGEPDSATLKALYPYRGWRPIRVVRIDQKTIDGPYTNPLPKDPPEQAKLPRLGYRDAWEALGERFHTTPAVIAALNPPGLTLKVGQALVVPNALPTSRAYPDIFPADWKATLNSLNVDARQPRGEKIVVDKSDSVLRVLDAQGKLVAQFQATMGSQHDPLPIGTWKIYGADYNPQFHYNPALFWDADKSDRKAMLPPGPNGPVGVIWIDLSKPHYGIHGTPSPETIGRAESHGCIRLTNWDAARLSLMVKPGTQAVFQE